MLANSAADGSDAGSDDEWDEDALATALEDALEPARPPDIAEGAARPDNCGRQIIPAPPSAIIAGPDLLSLLPDDLLLRVLQQLPLGPLTSVAMRVCRRIPPFSENGELLRKSLEVQQLKKKVMGAKLKEYAAVREERRISRFFIIFSEY